MSITESNATKVKNMSSGACHTLCLWFLSSEADVSQIMQWNRYNSIMLAALCLWQFIKLVPSHQSGCFIALLLDVFQKQIITWGKYKLFITDIGAFICKYSVYNTGDFNLHYRRAMSSQLHLRTLRQAGKSCPPLNFL